MTDCIVLWFQARFQNIFKDGAEETKGALRRNFWKNFMFIYLINEYTAINQLNICYIIGFFLSSLFSVFALFQNIFFVNSKEGCNPYTLPF